MQIVKNLIYLREKQGITRTKLAKELNLTEALLRAIEKGVSKNPRIDTVAKMASYFEISIDEFVYKDLSKENERSK